MRPSIDLSAHINQTLESGTPADFPVTLKPVFYRENGSYESARNRMAVVREDTGEALAVVSDRYTLVPHQQILDMIHAATSRLDVGSVPRGVYLDRSGARMRALFKFPALARPVAGGDDICPCVKIQNSYDATSRVTVHIGAFRFVCTDLAVGGGGAFAGGFMAVHAGEIPIDEMADRLSSYLSRFESIVELYRGWNVQPLDGDVVAELLSDFPKRPATALKERITPQRSSRDCVEAPRAYALPDDLDTSVPRSERRWHRTMWVMPGYFDALGGGVNQLYADLLTLDCQEGGSGCDLQTDTPGNGVEPDGATPNCLRDYGPSSN